jgi:formiminotetrahydrofolate cyclodeaminase
VGELTQRLLELVGKNTESYNQVMVASKLPREDEEQKAARHDAVKSATKEVALVPIETLRTIADPVRQIQEAVDRSNPERIADSEVAAQLILAAAMG